MGLLSSIKTLLFFTVPKGQEKHALTVLLACPDCQTQFDLGRPDFRDIGGLLYDLNLDKAFTQLKTVSACAGCKREILSPAKRVANTKRGYTVVGFDKEIEKARAEAETRALLKGRA